MINILANLEPLAAAYCILAICYVVAKVVISKSCDHTRTYIVSDAKGHKIAVKVDLGTPAKERGQILADKVTAFAQQA